jgi:hypothetical protein
MSERTMAEQAQVDFIFLTTRGSVSRELFSADRKRWHKALRAKAREHHRTIECGNHGMIAWAVLSYPTGHRRPAAVAYRD